MKLSRKNTIPAAIITVLIVMMINLAWIAAVIFVAVKILQWLGVV